MLQERFTIPPGRLYEPPQTRILVVVGSVTAPCMLSQLVHITVGKYKLFAMGTGNSTTVLPEVFVAEVGF